jgi:circadian clock protein KaiC
MKKNRLKSALEVSKARTGIEGFDEITHGGLPLGRATLIEGGPGSGKTIMALQSLVNGARLHNEAGIFVAFEESSERIRANAVRFGWDLDTLQKDKLFFLDAQPRADLCQSGAFDLGGMLAALEVKVREMGARRIVFDAVDMVLTLLNDPFAERCEVFRLHEWLLDRELTAILTSKACGHDSNAVKQPQLGFMQFMVDCAVLLNHEVRQGVSHRNLRVIKYRGSSFAENESPFLIGSTGLEVAGARELGRSDTPVTSERISTGVARLDTMLGGGYYRAASILITGFPGTAKSTLSGAFAEAACGRGERTLFVSFDSDASEVVRNLTSVNIRLQPYVKNGLLRLVSARAITGSAEVHLMQIKNLVRDFGARCLVIDPVSALAKTGNEGTAHSVAERLIDWTKAEGITVLCTSLLDEAGPHVEGTPLQVSTIADTWIHLNYLVHAGERNRGLSIVKSRGTAHSNQVRELVLSEAGVTLADVYTAGGEVLMGTLRWEKERALEAAREEMELATQHQRAAVEKEEAELVAKMGALEEVLKAKRLEKQGLKTRTAGHVTEVARDAAVLRGLRGKDRP